MERPENRRFIRYWLVVMMILPFLQGRLQGLDPHKKVEQYLVDQWDTAAGIPSDTILTISQTPDGYLWIGTSRGLVRFDGMKFTAPPFEKAEKIFTQEIRHLFVDRQGVLWIGSGAGLASYRSCQRGVKIFSPADGISDDGIRHIGENMRGDLWISFTASHVNRFSNGKFTAFDASHGLEGTKINAIVENSHGNLLFGSRENGIFSYRDGTFISFPVSGLKNVLITTMYEDRNSDLWIGTNNGLFRVNTLSGKTARRFSIRDGLSSDYITSLTEDSDRNLWVGTLRGLNRLKGDRDDTAGIEHLLSSHIINSLFEDREKSLWIGTDAEGMKRLKEGKFMSYAPLQTLMEEIPLSLFEDRQGNIRIGTATGKLLCCRNHQPIESLEIPELAGTGIAAIAEDPAGGLWLGTLGRGIIRQGDGGSLRLTTAEGLADNLVTSIFRDSSGNLWFGTFGGVSVRRNPDGRVESFTADSGLSGKVVHNIYEDRARNIWIAADKGITVLRGGKGAGSEIVGYLPGIPVTCLHEDSASPEGEGRTFWIATDGAGLKRLRYKENGDHAIKSFTTTQGMTSDFIYQFLEDNRGNFWLMSDSGLLRVGKSELNRCADGEAADVNCISYGIADGMKSMEFDNVYSRHSALHTRNGEFWFVTNKGISIVNPAMLRINKTPPPVVIEAVFFDRQPMALSPGAGGITGYGKKSIRFHFTAPTFLSPEKIRFKYRLEGVDSRWRTLFPGEERAVRYRDLTPGNYTFRVTACNAEGAWNPGGDSVTITLKSLFYQTALFKLAVLLAFVALVAAGLYLYKRRSAAGKARYRDSTLPPDFVQECITRLTYLMEIDKVYRDADITLQSLAEKLSVAPRLISRILNEQLQRNFADYINSYRIEEARKILQSPRGAGRKISAVAREAGFNTMVAFYKAFKKYTGMTPSQFKKETGADKKM